MSKSELQSDGTNAGAAASRLRCAKKVLDIHRQFIDDLMTVRSVMRIVARRYRVTILTSCHWELWCGSLRRGGDLLCGDR